MLDPERLITDRLRAIDNRRLLQCIAYPGRDILERIDVALREVLDLV